MTSKDALQFDGTRARCASRTATRRRLLRGILIASVGALALGMPSLTAQAASPIKIGVLLPLSGNFAELGQQTLIGMKIYFDEVGNKAGGHPLQILAEDTQGRPDVALTKARELQGEGAQVLTGVVSSGVALALNDYSRQHKLPLVFSGDAGADELTMPGPLANPYVVRTSQNSQTVAAVGADFAFKQGWRKVVTVGLDYAGGVDVNFSFAREFCRLGGQVVQAEWPPVGTVDFGPYLTSLNRTANAVETFAPGADGLRLARQYSEFGLTGKLPIIDVFSGLAAETNLSQLGNAALGIYTSKPYSPMLKTPENERFVAQFRKRKGGALPETEAANGWVGAHAIVDAINAVGGDLADTTKFMAALKAVKFDSPKGEISLDKYGQIVQSLYIRKVEMVNGQPQNVPIATYKNVDQFWPYTPAQYDSFKYTYKESKASLTDCTKLLAKK